MKAVISTGGKQYLVAQGDIVEIEKLDGAVGDKVVFDQVLLTGDDENVTVGTPLVAGAAVEGTIVDQTRAEKVWGIKYKPKKRYRMKFGHKQPITLVEIVSLGAAAKKTAKKEVA